MLATLMAKMKGSDLAQGNIGGLFIGIMVAAILGVAVAIPVVQDVINESNVTGTTATVLDLVPLFIGLLLLVALAGPLMRRVG
jgi:hypothetical protein